MRKILEPRYWQSVTTAFVKPKVPVLPYLPSHREMPDRQMQVPSAWDGLQYIIPDIIHRFSIGDESCLEFGVEFGFSTAALSSYFRSVIGVDTFQGDTHTSNKDDIYQLTKERLARFTNIQLVRSDYRRFIERESRHFDLIHIDIVHNYSDTYNCGLWSAAHSQCTLFHDTESFPQVKRAVIDIARTSGKTFYNYPECFGLGILV